MGLIQAELWVAWVAPGGVHGGHPLTRRALTRSPDAHRGRRPDISTGSVGLGLRIRGVKLSVVRINTDLMGLAVLLASENQAGHAAALAVAAVGKIFVALGEGAAVTTENPCNTAIVQSASRQTVQICLPAACRVGFKCCCRRGIVCNELLTYLVAYFECGLRYRRAQPGNDLIWGVQECGDGRFKNSGT